MAEITIDKNRCTLCGLCVSDCSRNSLSIENSSVLFHPEGCNECGHCFAICPCNAVAIGGYDDEEIISVTDEILNSVNADNFLMLQKCRRSIRAYKEQDVEPEKLEKIIEAGRYSPTAGNSQSNRYIVLKGKLADVRNAAITALNDMANDFSYDLGKSDHYRSIWNKMYVDYKNTHTDKLFFGAPAVIIIAADSKNSFTDVNAGIAASRMELTADTMGLGTCYIGFLKRAIEYDKSVKKLIGMKENEEYVLSFTLGYPGVQYERSVERKKADVRFL